MKRVVALFIIALALTACSTENAVDTDVIYSPTIGYLTNLTSAKHGIVGTWNSETGLESYSSDGEALYYNDISLCSSETRSSQECAICLTYTITEDGGTFYLNMYPASSKQLCWKYRISKLSETELVLIDTDGKNHANIRKSYAPIEDN